MKSENICTSDNLPLPRDGIFSNLGTLTQNKLNFPVKASEMPQKSNVGESFVEKIGNWDSIVLN